MSSKRTSKFPELSRDMYRKKGDCFMSGNSDPVKKKVKEWLQHADDDLRLARFAFKRTNL